MIYDAFNNDVTKELEKEEKKQKNIIPSKFIAKFYLGAVFSVGIETLENKKKYSQKEILEYLDILIPNHITKQKKF